MNDYKKILIPFSWKILKIFKEGNCLFIFLEKKKKFPKPMHLEHLLIFSNWEYVYTHLYVQLQSTKPARILRHESYTTNIIIQGSLLSHVCKYGSTRLGTTPMLKIHNISLLESGVAYGLIVEVIERLVIIERLIIIIVWVRCN